MPVQVVAMSEDAASAEGDACAERWDWARSIRDQVTSPGPFHVKGADRRLGHCG